MQLAQLAPPTQEELKAAFSRTELQKLGYTFEKAMEIEMFRKSITDIAIATRVTPTKNRKPAPVQRGLF